MIILKHRFVKFITLPIVVVMFLVISLAQNYADAKGVRQDNTAAQEDSESLKATVIAAEEDLIGDETDKKEEIKISEIQQIKSEERFSELENQIREYLGDRVNQVGLSFYETGTANRISINGEKTFLAASTVKVQMNMVLADSIVKGEVNPNEQLVYSEDFYEGGTGILQDEDLSNPLPLKLLSEYSIIYSDNIATNMIIGRLDYYRMRDLIDSKLGHATDHSDNFITPDDEVALLLQLYENKENNPYYTKIIEYMKNTEFHDRMDYYLPHEIVAHKIGNYDSYVNDVGIVYTKSPYILSIYTDGLDDAEIIIAHISKIIYDYENSIANE